MYLQWPDETISQEGGLILILSPYSIPFIGYRYGLSSLQMKVC